jgi:hypothetical protein
MFLFSCGMMVATTFYVVGTAFRTRASRLTRLGLISLLPLGIASLLLLQVLNVIDIIYRSEGMVDPGAIPFHVANGKRILASGWIMTGVALASLGAASRWKSK